MSEPKPPFNTDVLPPSGQVVADSFIHLVGALARDEATPASYADVMAGLIYALPVILAMADNDEAMHAMTAKFREYVGAEYFPTLVDQWADYVKAVIEHHEAGQPKPDFSTDTRFN